MLLYVPRGTSVVTGDWRVLQKVQLHVVVELLRRARVQGLRQVLDLCHEVIHVLLHGGEIQREALRGVDPVGPVRGRRWCAPRLRVAAASEPPRAQSSGLHQHQEQHWWNHSDRCHLIPPGLDVLPSKRNVSSRQERNDYYARFIRRHNTCRPLPETHRFNVN